MKKQLNELTFVGMVSEKLAQFAYNLMEMHGWDTNELEGTTYVQVKSIVDELSAKPMPPSQKQKETINRLVTDLRKWEPGFNIPKGVAQALTGGKEGSANEMIQFLFQKMNKYSGMGEPTEGQIEKITSWYTCIDIDWEALGFQLRKPYPTPTNPNGWMMVTPDEFKAQIAGKFTKDQASEFIGANSRVYYEWKATRVSDNQVNTIRNLEERLATISTVGTRGYAQDEEGNVIEVYHKVAELVDNRAYQPMDEYIIRQMDSKVASQYIIQLESELYKKRKSSISNSQQQQEFEDKAKILSGAKKEVTQATNKFQAMVDFVFKLEAVGGYQMDELQESVQEVYIKREMAETQLTLLLVETMNYLIDEKYITINGMIDMAKDCELAEKIMMAKYPSEYDQAINGKRERGEDIPVTQLNDKKEESTMDIKSWMEAMK